MKWLVWRFFGIFTGFFKDSLKILKKIEKRTTWPNIKLPFADTQQPADDVAAVDADSHVDVDVVLCPNIGDDVNHLNARFDAVLGVFLRRYGKTGNAVVAIAQNFDSQTIVSLSN